MRKSSSVRRSSVKRELLSDPVFRRFASARVIAYGGTTIPTVALPMLVFQKTGSTLQTALLLTIQTVPYLLFGLVAGAVADRTNRQRMMVVCDTLSLLLLGSIPFAAAFDVLTLTHIYGVALGTATCFVWFDAANFGALPALVGSARVVAAQSLIWSAEGVFLVLGPAIAGILIALMGPALALTVDAAGYATSAVLLASIRRPFRVNAAVVGKRSTMSQIREGLHFLWQHRVIRALTLTGAGNSFAGGAVIGLLVVYSVDQLGLRSDDARVGLLFTAGAFGAELLISACSNAAPRPMTGSSTRRWPGFRRTEVGEGSETRYAVFEQTCGQGIPDCQRLVPALGKGVGDRGVTDPQHREMAQSVREHVHDGNGTGIAGPSYPG
ncbi:MAG: MFS transporter [Pseudonocardiaceae bacterium]